jgi:N-methylhydantoinase B
MTEETPRSKADNSREAAAATEPVLREVIRHHLAAVAEEMALIVWTTGRSPMLKTGDFVTVVADEHGNVIGQGFGASFQFALMQDLIVNVIDRRSDLAEGDVFVANDPYSGVAHMPDVAVVSPVFWKGRLVGFCACYSHHSDIGGRFPGGFSSLSKTIYEEGLRLPILKLYEGGRENTELLRAISANVRAPDEWLGDLHAKVAGCIRGTAGIGELLDKYGYDPVATACQQLIKHTEAAARAVISDIPDGSYLHEEFIEDDGFTDRGQITLRLTLRVSGDELIADYSGTSNQLPSALNMPFGVTRAATVGAVHALIGNDIPANAGLSRPITVVAPAGSVLNPNFPSPVGAYTPIFFRVSEMVLRALAKAMPGKIPVPAEGADVIHFFSDRPDGQIAMMDLFYGGWGGRPHKDGIDGVAPVYMGSHGSIGIELIERQYPVVVEGFGYVPDSGGPGQYRGSLAVYRRWRFLTSGEVNVRTVRLGPSAGLSGGAEGSLSATSLEVDGATEVIKQRAHIHVTVNPGDRLYHRTAGAGGFGDPRSRDPVAVQADVIDGKVTVDSARMDYGVVLDATTLRVDRDATERERKVDLADARAHE